MSKNMRKLPWASVALSILCAMGLAVAAVSCQTLAPANNGGTPDEETPSSKDDDSKKDDTGDIYVLDSVIEEYTVNGKQYADVIFRDAEYVKEDWSDVPVFKSYLSTYTSVEDNKTVEKEGRTEYVYSYPSYVYVYRGSDLVGKVSLNGEGLVSSIVDGDETTTYQYDSRNRLVKKGVSYEFIHGGQEYSLTFSYDASSRIVKADYEEYDDEGLYTYVANIEYSDILSKTSAPLQGLTDSVYLFYGSFCDFRESFFLESGLMGSLFGDRLIRRITCDTCDGQHCIQEFDYSFDKRGYVKEMKVTSTLWYDGDEQNSETEIKTDIFSWKKFAK